MGGEGRGGEVRRGGRVIPGRLRRRRGANQGACGRPLPYTGDRSVVAGQPAVWWRRYRIVCGLRGVVGPARAGAQGAGYRVHSVHTSGARHTFAPSPLSHHEQTNTHAHAHPPGTTGLRLTKPMDRGVRANTWEPGMGCGPNMYCGRGSRGSSRGVCVGRGGGHESYPCVQVWQEWKEVVERWWRGVEGSCREYVVLGQVRLPVG